MQALHPTCWCRPTGQMRNCFGPLSFVQIDPHALEVIEVAAESETAAQALLNASASALVPALSLSAHSSPVAECEPRPKIISSQETNTLATIFWSLLRSKLALV